MIKGLFTEEIVYRSDFSSCEYWDPQKYGVSIELLTEEIIKKGISKDIKFVLASDVYHSRNQEMLRRFKQDHGVKIFFSSREPVVPNMSATALFSRKRFMKECGHYYFTPDMVFGSGRHYCELWADKAKCAVTGYPRFERYLSYKQEDVPEIRKKYGLAADRKLVFFPSFPDRMYKQLNGKDNWMHLEYELETIIKALEEISKNPRFQVVIKVHPTPFKAYRRCLAGKRQPFPMRGLLKHYYEHKDPNIIVLGDDRADKTIVKDLVVASDIVLGATSTVLLESLLLNKPVLNCAVGQLKVEDMLELSTETKTVTSQQEIVDAVLSDNVKPLVGPSKLVEKYIGPVDGKTCERMCELIKNNI